MSDETITNLAEYKTRRKDHARPGQPRNCCDEHTHCHCHHHHCSCWGYGYWWNHYHYPMVTWGAAGVMPCGTYEVNTGQTYQATTVTSSIASGALDTYDIKLS